MRARALLLIVLLAGGATIAAALLRDDTAGTAPETPGGGTRGRELTLWTFDAERPYLPNPKKMAILLKSQLERAGFRIRIVDHDRASHFEMTQNGEHDLAILGWTGDTGDPDNFLYVLLGAQGAIVGSASNISFYRDGEVTGWLVAAQVARTREERRNLYLRAQRKIEEDAPLIPIAHGIQAAAFRREVEGFSLHPTGQYLFDRTRVPGRTLRFARGSDSTKLDPADITDGESALVTENLFEGLVRYTREGVDVEPALATGWEVDPTGTVWTFALRERALFHDGTPVDAAAVVFSFERQRDPGHPHAPAAPVYWRDQFADVERVEAIDPRTVRFTLKRPFAPFLTNLAMFSAGIVSPIAFERAQTPFERNPVGSGPFRFVSWSVNDRIELEAFGGHWEGRPACDRVTILTIPDNATRLVALREGSIHGMKGINPQDLDEVRADPTLRLLEQPGMNVAYLACNTMRPPLDDPLVRRSIARAIDKEAIRDLVYRGNAVVARSVLPPTLWAHPDYDGE
ncbi:MAG: hypothetical protein HY608_03245 [Planctomycetes bacterium]|nr:hypothetical protein [Planctomycetota bacterium]